VRNAIQILVRKLEGRRPLERPRFIWEDNIKIDFIKVRCNDVDWIRLAQTVV
jgi:hypothetical protein